MDTLKHISVLECRKFARICPVCGAVFVSLTGKEEYCSEHCRVMGNDIINAAFRGEGIKPSLYRLAGETENTGHGTCDCDPPCTGCSCLGERPADNATQEAFVWRVQ